jgi:SAM-dependent methyltransferase
MLKVTWIDYQLRTYALARYKAFNTLPLSQLKAPSPLFCTLSSPLLAFLYSDRDAVVQWIDDGVNSNSSQAQSEVTKFFLQHTLEFLRAKNQFLVVPEPEKAALGAEYIRFLSDFRNVLDKNQTHNRLADNLKTILAEHQTQLEQFVYNLADSNMSHSFIFSTPTCGYYSPVLQMQILHTSVEQLLEPILDLGCGQGELVQFLRDRAQQAIGVDCSISSNPFCLCSDWFNFPFTPGTWGTVISHMAFSLHFLHHYLRGSNHLEHYAQGYMDVLSALKSGGSFLYTPGLPFIEALLPQEKYRVERFEIAQVSTAHVVEYLQKFYEIDVICTCKVTSN